MATTETLNIVITTKAKGDGAAKAEKGLQGLVKAAKAFAGIAAVGAVAKQAVELGKLGIASQAAALRFERFAGTAESAEHFLDAFNEGAQGTVDRMTAMASASRLLQMGLVETTDDMEQVASMATKLGDQTMGAGDRISDFAAMLANQSIPRLDNFGISSGRVRARIDELLKSGQALNREEAFKMAVMEEGAKALERLGDTTETTAHQMDVAKASWQDMKRSMGEIIATAGAATGAFGFVADRLGGVADMYQSVSEHGTSAQAVFSAWLSIFDKSTTMTEAYVSALEKEAGATVDAARGQALLSGEYDRTLPIQEQLTWETDNTAEAHEQYQAALAETEHVSDMAARATLELAAAEDEATAATQRHTDYLFQASQSFTDFYRRQEETAADYSKRLEDAEAKHQDKLAKLAEQGQSRRVAVDEEGLALEVRIAQGRLDQLLEKRAEFDAETTDLERARAEKSIRALEKEIGEKTGLLERAANGYVTIAGKNVDELTALERERYAEEIAMLEENRAKQEEEQKRSLGQMVLNNFNAWSEMALAADGWTDEEIKYVQEMQAKIAEEYGLITETAATETARQAQYWADTVAIMRGDADGFFDAFSARFNALPSEKLIRIRTELSGRPVDIPDKPTSGGGGGGGGGSTGGTGGSSGGGGGSRGGGDVQGAGLLSRTRPVATPSATMTAGGGAAVGGGLTINATIVSDDPAVIWKKLEQYARLKGKSGWQQLGR